MGVTSRWRRAVAALVTSVALLAAACSANTSQSGTPQAESTGIGQTGVTTDQNSGAARSTAAAPPEDAPVYSALAAAGIDVVPDDAPRSGRGMLTVTASQASVWADQWHRAAGLTGSELRERFPTGDTAVPLDALIAAWLTTSTGAAPDAARQLMDPTEIADPKDSHYPWAVVAIFVQTVTSADGSTSSPASSAPSRFRAPSEGGFDPCGALTGMYESVVNKITSWFSTVAGDSTIVAIAGEALSLFGSYLGKAISTVLAPLLAPIKAAIGAVGLAASIAGALVPWTAQITASPTDAAFGISPAPGQSGQFALQVSTPLPDWPVAVKSCASLIGVDLPSITPEGSAVDWTFSGGAVATEEHRDSTLTGGAEPTATLDFITGTESAEQAKGSVVVDPVYVSAKVTRDTTALAAVLNKLIGSVLGSLPDLIALLVIDPATDALASVLQLAGTEAKSGPVQVTHHLPPPDPPKDVPPKDVPGDEPPSPPAEESCVAQDLVSQLNKTTSGDMSTIMPGAVELWLDPGHTGYLDFDDSTDFFGDNFTGHVTGKITFHWSGGPTHFATSDARGTLTARIKTMGTDNTIELPVETIVQNSESMVCHDGEITISRTGWVFY